MTPEQFCYWLQGAFETMDEGRGLSQFDHIVRDHLKTVFDKKTPDYQKLPYTIPGTTGPNVPQFPTGPIC